MGNCTPVNLKTNVASVVEMVTPATGSQDLTGKGPHS